MSALLLLGGALGDVVVATPVVAALARAGPVEVWTAAASRAWPLRAPRGPAAAAREWPAHALPLWSDEALPPMLEAALRVRSRLVAVTGDGPLARHVRRLGGLVLAPPARAGAPGPPGHVTDALLAGLAAGGVDVDGVDPRPRLEPTADDVARGRALAGRDRFALVHPGSGGVAKQWPPASFARALAGLEVVIVTGPAERDRGLELGPLAGAHLQEPPIEELVALIAACGAFLGNDAGPTHLAAACGAPTVAVFVGPSDAGRWGPRGRGPVRVLREPTTEAVAQALREALGERPPRNA